MNDKAHMQTQNGFIGWLNLFVFHFYKKKYKTNVWYGARLWRRHKEKRGMENECKSQEWYSPWDISPLELLLGKLKSWERRRKKRDETFYHPNEKVLRGMFWMWINGSYYDIKINEILIRVTLKILVVRLVRIISN